MALLVGLVGGYLLVAGATFATLVGDPDLILLTALVLLVGGWFCWRRMGRWEAVPPVAMWLAGAMVWIFLDSWLGQSPRQGLDEAYRTGWMFAALCAGLVAGRSPDRLAAAVTGLLLAAAPVAWLAVSEVLGWRVPQVLYLTEFGQPRAAATLNHPNNLAGFIALLAPLALGMAAGLVRRRERRAAVPTVLAVMLLIGAAGTYSKGGQLAVLGGLVIWLVLLPPAGWRPWLASQTARRRWLPAALILVAAAGLVGFWLSPFAARLRLFGDLLPTLPRFERWGTWLAAGRMVLDHPLRGVGPGAFGLAFPAYKAAGSHAQLFTHAHNWLLQVVAEQGLIGLLLWLGAIIAGLDALVRCLRLEPEPARRTLLQGLLAGQVGFLLAGLLDYNVGVPSIGLTFWFCVGLGAAGDPVGGRSGASRALLVTGSGLATLLFLPWLAFNRGQVAYLESCQHIANGRLAEAAAALEVARARDPLQRGYDLVRADLADWTGQPQLCEELLSTLARERRSGLPSYYLDRLAWLAMARQDAGEARRWLHEAIARDPAEPSLRVDLGLVSLASAPEEAREAFEHAAALSPNAIGARAGQGALALQAHRPAEAAERWQAGTEVGDPRDRPPRFLIAYGCLDPAARLPISLAGVAHAGRVRYQGAALPRLRLLALELAALAELDPSTPGPAGTSTLPEP